jgi:hypothetical protein
MEEKIVDAITGSVERVLRYLIPGVAFFLSLFLSDSTVLNSVPSVISGNGFVAFLVILTVGMTIYVIYSLIIRFTLERIVFKRGISPVNLYCTDKSMRNYSKAHAELLINRKREKDYPNGYYTYLWSITHYAIILSIMVIIFVIKIKSICVGILGIGILCLALWSYVYLQKLEKDTMAILKLGKNNAVRQESGNNSGE